MNDTPAQISVRGLHVRYDGRDVLHDVSFDVRRGEFLAIVGRSGVGKSTLLLALAGLIPSVGEFRVPEDLGFVFQDHAVYPWLRVYQQVGLGIRGVKRREKQEIVARLLDLVGLSEHAAKYPAQLSGGQAQRVAVARALAPNPEVIFMDEPFGALDTYTRTRMQNWLLDLQERDRRTTLFITHDVEESIALADRVLLFGDHSISEEYHIPYARPRAPDIRFDSAFIELKRRIVQRMTLD
jgi:ABC-type nitrate/sulfonate/bicarbonate transport system ATPase subunit